MTDRRCVHHLRGHRCSRARGMYIVQYVNPIITVASKVVFKMLCGLRMIEITSQYVRNLQMRQLKDVWLAYGVRTVRNILPRVGGKSQYSSLHGRRMWPHSAEFSIEKRSHAATCRLSFSWRYYIPILQSARTRPGPSSE
jgi:hypothetical protein